MIASKFLYFPLLTALAQAGSISTCGPPAPPIFLPEASDCLKVASAIARLGDTQKDTPQVWSRAPVAPGRGVQLLYVFVLQDSDCEVLVDMVYATAADIFPMREISSAAVDLVAMCLFRMGTRGPSVGHALVGPGEKVLVYIRKHFWAQMITGKNNTALAFNETESAVTEVGFDSGANLTSTG